MDITSTLEYYEDLLLYQYVDKPKARATIGVLAQAALCDLVAIDIGEAFDIETAEGVQLDVLGEYIGRPRAIVTELTWDFFRMVDYTAPVDDTTGFTDYTDVAINVGSVFYRYYMVGQANNVMNDDEYRYMLKFKAALNSIDHTLYSIVGVFWDFFGDSIRVVDNADMTMEYHVSPTANQFAQLAISQGMLPKPVGVAITVIED